jgi:serine kinase of HPr protein (carbohydrate metabolism regulator)
MIVHATCVARRLGSGWRGVLLFGPSGAGKSDLALRALDQGFRLVSDDYSAVWRSGGALWATAPDALRGRIEARGLGILAVPSLRFAAVDVAVKCQEEPPERLPDPEIVELEGLPLPCIRVRALEPSAVAKLSHALAERAAALGHGARSEYVVASPDAAPVDLRSREA